VIVLQLILTDKNSLFGGVSIGNMELCVKTKRFATYGGSGLSSQRGPVKDSGAGRGEIRYYEGPWISYKR